jgi:hypothetical protein
MVLIAVGHVLQPMHLGVSSVLPVCCQCIASVLLVYGRCTAIILPMYCQCMNSQCIASVLPLYCQSVSPVAGPGGAGRPLPSVSSQPQQVG